MRLTRDAYLAVQSIYYPGFTIAGISEPLAFVAVLILLLLTPPEALAFRFSVVALLGLAGMPGRLLDGHSPDHKSWLQGANVTPGNVGGGFSHSRRGVPRT